MLRRRERKPALTGAMMNRMLSCLLEIEPSLRNSTESVWLKGGQLIHHTDREADHVFFPEGCILAMTAKNARGKWTDVWLSGREGLFGATALLVDVRHPFRSQVRASGHAWRFKQSVLANLLQQSAASRNLLQRYSSFVLVQTAQVGLCNAAHSLDERIRRYLLFAHWLSGLRSLQLTHSLIADGLGVHRPSVTRCLHQLEDGGGLSLERSSIAIHDRSKLERGACPCCKTFLAHYERLFAAPSPSAVSNEAVALSSFEADSGKQAGVPLASSSVDGRDRRRLP
jgi:CRP-like cAMP-binding protein